MARPIARTLAPLFLALLAAGAARAAEGTPVPEKSYPLSPGGRFSLENVNGDVTITAWDKAEVSLLAVKSGANADKIEVKVAATKDAVQVTTEYPSSYWGFRSSSGTVDYTVKVPRDCRIEAVEVVNGNVVIEGVSGRVSASAVNGTLDAKDLAGDVELESVNGALTLGLLRLGPDQSVSVTSVNGSISVKLAAGVGAEVAAETINGRITNDFGVNVDKGRWVGSSMSGRVGAGGGHIKLETVNGPIDLGKL